MSRLLQRTAEELASVNGSTPTVSQETPVCWLPLDRIRDNPYQPRQHYDAEHILNLALSIKALKKELPATKGLQQIPLARAGRLVADGFETAPKLLHGDLPELRWLLREPDTIVQLMFGHSRLRAWRLIRKGLGILLGKRTEDLQELGIDIDLAGLYESANRSTFETHYADLMQPDPEYATFPITLGYAEDLDMWRHAITENSQRKNINAIEEARAMQIAQKQFGLTDEEAGKPFGYARSTTANKLRLLNLPAEVQRDIAAGKLTERHGRELLRLADDPKQILEVHQAAVKGQKSVAQLTQDVNWRAEQLKAKQEQQRQLAVAKEILAAGWTPPGSTEPLPVERVGNASYTFDTAEDKAILEAGLCGSQCQCCVLTYRSYNFDSMVRPDAERAPRIGLGCTGGWEAMNPKQAALRKLQQDGQLGPSEAERRLLEEKAQRQAKITDLQREARAKWEKALAKLNKESLPQDLRFWRVASRELQYRLRDLTQKAQSLPELVDAILEQLLQEAWEYSRELQGSIPDESKLDRLITALTQPLKRTAQPQPGDSQATGWQDEWTEDDDAIYDELTENYGEYTELIALIDAAIECDNFPTPRVLLRLIEECEEKAIRGELWRRYNELTGESVSRETVEEAPL